MFRFKRYDEGLFAESLTRFGWEKLVCLPIESQTARRWRCCFVKR